MLTPETKKKIDRGLNLGCTDTLLAKLLGLSHMQVFTYRKSKGIRSKQIQENRYRIWKELIEKGVDLEEIAENYEVKPTSIKMALWKAYKFSFVEVKKQIKLTKAKSKKNIIRL